MIILLVSIGAIIRVFIFFLTKSIIYYGRENIFSTNIIILHIRTRKKKRLTFSVSHITYKFKNNSSFDNPTRMVQYYILQIKSDLCITRYICKNI